jgi:hypothetical protein
VDHQEAGVGVRRLQGAAAAVVVVLAIGAAAFADGQIGPKAPGAGAEGVAPSGAWYCPHGGGAEGWEAVLQVANPGPEPATIRVQTLGPRRPTGLETFTVNPGSFLRVPVPADDRARSSTVEWFGQWVAVGWVAHAGGGEGGVAAEPCAPAATTRWLLPDGTTETEEHDDFVVVTNPFARDAVFSVALLSERRTPVRRGDLTDVVLRPYRSVAIRLNDVVLGERTVSTLVEASVGRVVAATLGISRTGGIRASLGYPGPPSPELVLPGGADAGRTELVVMSTATERVEIAGELLQADSAQPFAGLADSAPPGESGRTFPSSTEGPTSVAFVAAAPDLAPARRTYGLVSDQGSTGGAEPAPAWVVLPAVFGSPSHPGLVLANPGPAPARVALSYLAPDGAEPVVVTVPGGRTAVVPEAFVEAAPEGGILAIATSGTFVPAAASYSRGREGYATYAVALGVPIPAAWAPA